MFLYFINNTFTITDLDQDGNAEVWIMYKVSCQGDVAPIPMKVIMYENDKKFAIRGTTQVAYSADQVLGGEYTFDYAFKNAPAAFKEYGRKLWEEHKKEDWEQ